LHASIFPFLVPFCTLFVAQQRFTFSTDQYVLNTGSDQATKLLW
jgi:hypothetical protein